MTPTMKLGSNPQVPPYFRHQLRNLVVRSEGELPAYEAHLSFDVQNVDWSFVM